VVARARQHGFDPRTELLPVTPAAHYCMGGVAVDRTGRASLRGLWAIGETSSSGLHGANRLASNSLLEGLVLAGTVAADAAGGAWRSSDPLGLFSIPADLADLDDLDERGGLRGAAGPGAAAAPGDDRSPPVAELRRLLWQGAGVERDRAGLLALTERLAAPPVGAARSLRVRTIQVVAALVAAAALARTESRGAHYRADHPVADPAQAHRRIEVPLPVATEPWSLEPLSERSGSALTG
jgi:L-aspartate oxidase